ncbi:MAG: hypothetical protein HKN14_03460 [Marinicaulis sp.]|nr:hypothetical protein [Marinicaulis sp.]NNE39960.1 hypothetical protein [Marinicaulis sp.]NNL88025.1 hypothetical protein [Marinicaulis sp.]
MTDADRNIEKNTVERVVGSSPRRTVIQLIIASIIVGAIFSVLDLGALEFWRGIFDTLTSLIRSIGDSFGEIAVNLITYLIIGAAIVIPVWLIMRLIRGR